jgi:hypothetical protein
MLAAKENKNNIKDYSFTCADGTIDRQVEQMGIPNSWQLLEKMPKSGVFRAKYICSVEERCFEERARLMNSFGFWIAPTSADEVMWWSSITECPEDVVAFVDWISSHFDDIYVVLQKINGPDGNGVISLREFEEGIDAIGCKKFEGIDKSERVRIVFRYLDPSGEGISDKEWGVLQQLYDEIRLCIREFVEFCERTFDTLEAAWAALHDNDRKHGRRRKMMIGKEEWMSHCHNLGYFGLTAPVFAYLDADDEGAVSPDKFCKLKTFDAKTCRPPAQKNK